MPSSLFILNSSAIVSLAFPAHVQPRALVLGGPQGRASRSTPPLPQFILKRIEFQREKQNILQVRTRTSVNYPEPHISTLLMQENQVRQIKLTPVDKALKGLFYKKTETPISYEESVMEPLSLCSSQWFPLTLQRL